VSSHTRWGGKSSRRYRSFLPVQGPNAGRVAFSLLSCDSLRSSVNRTKHRDRPSSGPRSDGSTATITTTSPKGVIDVSPAALLPGLVVKENGSRDAKGRLPTGQRWFRGTRVEIHWRRAARARNSCAQRMPDDTLEDFVTGHTKGYDYECIPQQHREWCVQCAVDAHCGLCWQNANARAPSLGYEVSQSIVPASASRSIPELPFGFKRLEGSSKGKTWARRDC
jgi:hypothetical protein